MSFNKDSVGDEIIAERASWSFGEDTCLKFDDHVSKSVPGYQEGHEIILSLSDYFVSRENSLVIDIGSSTGSLIKKLTARHQNKKLNFVGIDPVLEMCNLSRNKFSTDNDNVQFECCDFLDYQFNQSMSICISYYTMQFIHPSVRQEFVNKIYNSLEWGGGLYSYLKN